MTRRENTNNPQVLVDGYQTTRPADNSDRDKSARK